MDVIELIKKDLQNRKDSFGRPMIDTVVVLKKDDKGYYIEYAFKEGAPHDNRCLSWYDSYQEEAYIRNGWVKGMSEEAARQHLDAIRSDREQRIGKVFRLSSFSCSYEEDEEGSLNERRASWEKYHGDEPFIPQNHICKPGCPAKECAWAKDWNYESPKKCACWYLRDEMSMEDYINNYHLNSRAVDLVKTL